MAGGEAAAVPHPAELEPGAGLLPTRAQLQGVWAQKPDFGTWSQLAPMCPECLADELRPLGPAQVKYSDFISGLQRENIGVNRKMLSELAANEPYSFKALVDQVRSHAVAPLAFHMLCPLCISHAFRCSSQALVGQVRGHARISNVSTWQPVRWPCLSIQYK